MTWPPPPPSSDPWSSEPDPWAAEPDPAGDTAADPPPGPSFEPEPEPAASPEPDEEPTPEPVLDPEPVAPPVEPEHQEPSPSIDAGYPVEAEYFPPPQAPAPGSVPPPVASPAPGPDGWSAYSHSPPPVVPRPQVAPPPSKKPVWLAAAAVAAVIVVGVIAWLVLPSGGDDAAPPATTTSVTPTADAAAEARLLGVLPAGYRAGTCEVVSAPTGARAAASCGPNTDPGGPASSTFTVAKDGAALDAAFNAVVNGSTRVNCPGNIQSPGPWRRNATPEKVSGVLFCGIQQNRPVVAWTNVDESLLVVAESGPQGPNLDQLYLWWSSHS